MEEKKRIFDYLSQVMVIFGFVVFTLNIFCLIFGSSAKEFSSIFELGNQGISVNTAFQFFGVSVLITGLRFIFFTDTVFKKMAVWLRIACMLAGVVGVMVIFIVAFQWFPVDMWEPWILFFLCFGICFVSSYMLFSVKERTENKKLEEALLRLKEREEGKDEHSS